MKIKAKYDKQEDIPEGFAELYTEKDGAWEFTGIEGGVGQGDVARVQKALDSERKAHKATKDALKVWTVLGDDPEELQTKLDRFDELEAAAGGKIDEAKIEELVTKRITAKTAPLQRELDKAKRERDEATTKVTELDGTIKKGKIADAVRAAATKEKVVPFAIDDVALLAERVFEVGEDGVVTAKDGVGVTPGISVEAWLSDQKEKRPHWWPESKGSGARGGEGGAGGGFKENPWSAEHWNMTAQGAIVKSDRARADKMASAAGVKVGATAPLKKAA